MRNPSEIWRQRLWVWVPALVFFLANATAYTVYRFGFADRVASLRQDLQDERERLDPLVARKKKLEGLLALSASNEVEIHKLYNETFATRKQRLTEITTEVKTLARKAGLDPKDLSYPETQIERYGLIKRSFVFSVQGNYLELRKLINLLELSQSFLTLEEVMLSEGVAGNAGQANGGAGDPGAELRINLTISTLFAKDPNDVDAPVTPRRSS